MISVKEQILATLNELPDNTTWDDALYALYLHSKLRQSEEDIKNGKTVTMQELKQYISGLEEKYANKNI